MPLSVLPLDIFSGKNLNKIDKAQKTFFENTSHELKTPLMAICGYAEEIEMGVITDYSQAGRMIVSQTERMSKLIEDILYLSKIGKRYGTIKV